MGVVVLVHDTDTIERVAEVLSQACEMRVARFRASAIVVAGVTLDPNLTVTTANLNALDRIDLVPAGE